MHNYPLVPDSIGTTYGSNEYLADATAAGPPDNDHNDDN